jgi:cytochrome c
MSKNMPILRLCAVAVAGALAGGSVATTALGARSSGSGAPPLPAQAARDIAAAEIHVGRVLFKRKCGRCHVEDAAINDVGPTLYGVVGRPAASVPDFAYSGALRTSELVWTEQNLVRYINDPHAFVPCHRMRIRAVTMCPGIHMKFHGFRNIYAAKAVVAYLKSLAPAKAHPTR